MILIAVLIPPLSFFLRGKIISGIICSILYIISIVLAFTGLGLIIGLPLEFALVIWAVISRVNGRNDEKLKQMENRLTASQITNEK